MWSVKMRPKAGLTMRAARAASDKGWADGVTTRFGVEVVMAAMGTSEQYPYCSA